MYEVNPEDGAGNEFTILKSFKNELKKVHFKILRVTKNLELLGNLVKTEPILWNLVKILEIWVHNTCTISLCSPSTKIDEEIGSSNDVLVAIGICSN